MATTLRHRGPDSGGIWTDNSIGIALGHRRLSIIDLSPTGQQPMMSETGNFVIIFNGEIYNFKILREELKKYPYQGNSDTEVLLAAIETWGVEQAITRLNGMFAFAVWDRNGRVLWLARDRVGKKPLYYGWQSKTFLFGSELRALEAHPHFHPEIHRGAIGLLLKYGYIPAPFSIYHKIYKLPPGCLMKLTMEGLASGGQSWSPFPGREITAYWSVGDLADRAKKNPFKGSHEDAVEELDHLLRDAVSDRMLADVPLGAFLSGGVDSSVVVALMQAQSHRPVKTFSIGFEEKEYNEAPYAAAIARQVGSEHTELYVSIRDARDLIPKLTDIFDEPFADSSQIPTYLLAKLARQHVTVALTGDGGDELFVGYNRYSLAGRVFSAASCLPGAIRKRFARSLADIARALSGWPQGSAFHDDSKLPFFNRPQEKIEKLARLAEASSVEEFYEALLCYCLHPDELLLSYPGDPSTYWSMSDFSHVKNFIQRVMFADLGTYLPDDNLAKVDRATMAVALEARAPLLDSRVVEFASRVPLHIKFYKREKKWLLKQVLYRYVPRQLIERPKMGFSVPISQWLRQDLREWAEDLLDERLMSRQGIFNPQVVRQRWLEHLQGRANRQHELWSILMFQAWLAKFERQSFGTKPGINLEE